MLTPASVANDTGGLVTEDEAAVLIENGLDFVQGYCGWHVFPEKAETLVLDGCGGNIQYLPTLRIVNILRVVEDGRELPPDDYEWSASGTLRKRAGRWTDRYRGVEVELVHGFRRVPTIEGIVSKMICRSAANPTGRTSMRVGERQESYSTFGGIAGSFMPMQNELAVLDHYRLNWELS